jgi:hypothetical protein
MAGIHHKIRRVVAARRAAFEPLALETGKKNPVLAQPCAPACPSPGRIFAAPFDQREIGPDLFKAACQMGQRASCRSWPQAVQFLLSSPSGRTEALERCSRATGNEPQ